MTQRESIESAASELSARLDEQPARYVEPVDQTQDLAPAESTTLTKTETAAVSVRRDSSGHFLPGVSGNPAGPGVVAPKIKPALARLLDLEPRELTKYKPKTVAEELAQRAILEARSREAFHGGLGDRQFIADRIDGPVERGATVNVGVQVVIREYGGSGKPEDIG